MSLPSYVVSYIRDEGDEPPYCVYHGMDGVMEFVRDMLQHGGVPIKDLGQIFKIEVYSPYFEERLTISEFVERFEKIRGSLLFQAFMKMEKE